MPMLPHPSRPSDMVREAIYSEEEHRYQCSAGVDSSGSLLDLGAAMSTEGQRLAMPGPRQPLGSSAKMAIVS